MKFIDKLQDIFLGGNTLYYPGCLTRFVSKNIEKNYREILDISGISYVILNNELSCCGCPVHNAGYKGDFQELAKRNYKTLKAHRIKKIITNCPACYNVFVNEYPKIIPEWNIKTEHTSSLIWNLINNNELEIIKNKKEEITYHDPCHLSRYSEIIDEPRNILKKIGYTIIEMEKNKKNSMCCGGGGGLIGADKELADAIAKKRIKQAEETGTKKVITSCPLCMEHLKRNSNKIEVIEISEVILNAVRKPK